jgi:hypothetical protein
VTKPKKATTKPAPRYTPGWRRLVPRVQFVENLRRYRDAARADLYRLAMGLVGEGMASVEVRKLLRGAEERLRVEEVRAKRGGGA